MVNLIFKAMVHLKSDTDIINGEKKIYILPVSFSVSKNSQKKGFAVINSQSSMIVCI